MPPIRNSPGIFFLCCVTFFAIEGRAWAQEDSAGSERLLVQWQTYMQTPQFVALLNEYAAPKNINPKSSADLFSAIQEQCNIDASAPKTPSANAFTEGLLRANKAPDIQSLAKQIDEQAGGMAVSLPFCVPESSVKAITVGPGDTVEKLLMRYFGEAGGRTITRFNELNDGKDRKPFTNLKVGQTINIPVLKTWQSVPLKPGKNFADFQLEAAVLINDGQTPTSAPADNDAQPAKQEAAPPGIYQEKQSSGAAPKPPAPSETCPGPIDDPLDRARIGQILAMNEKLLEIGEIRKGSLQKSNIAVVDFGFDMALVRNAAPSPFQSWVNGNLSDDASGSDIIENLPLLTQNKEEARQYYHGISVVFQTGGGKAVLEDSLLHRYVDDALVVKPLGYLQAVSSGTGSSLTVSDGSIAQAFGRIEEAKIVNISGGTFGFSSDKSLWINRIQPLTPNTLFIVAAGNDKYKFDNSADPTKSVYPAYFGGTGGKFGENVITVGAIEGSLKSSDSPKKWEHSNYSPIYVDLMAPGCRILIPESDIQNSVPLDGTSFAAPLVTFAVGMIKFYSQSSNASRIKARLMESARLESGLAKFASRGSVLDPAALSVYLDVVKVKTASGNEETYYGYLRENRDQILKKICTDESVTDLTIGVDHARRLHRSIDSDKQEVLDVLARNDRDGLDSDHCHLLATNTNTISLVPFDASAAMSPAQPVELQAGEIQDIVFSQRDEDSIIGMFQQSKNTKGCRVLKALGLISRCASPPQ